VVVFPRPVIVTVAHRVNLARGLMPIGDVNRLDRMVVMCGGVNGMIVMGG
jgi:hypothetical protein